MCNNAKAYAEELFGGPIMTRAHATWQESPTCDHYYKKANAIGGFNLADKLDEKYRNITSKSPVEDRAALEKAKMEKAKEMGISRYEYTPYYDWSASIRENTSACYDYFKWNEFLTGSGTDHPKAATWTGTISVRPSHPASVPSTPSVPLTALAGACLRPFRSILILWARLSATSTATRTLTLWRVWSTDPVMCWRCIPLS